jgi:hypothetical protein
MIGTSTAAAPDTLQEGWARATLVDTGASARGQVAVETTDGDEPVVVTGPRLKVEVFLERMGVSVAALLEVPARPSSPSWTEDVTLEFDALVRQWLDESLYMSSLTDMVMLFSYQRIIGLGPAAVPLILKSMQTCPQHWFWALEAITGENPVALEHVGSLPAMTEDWLARGRGAGVLD